MSGRSAFFVSLPLFAGQMRAPLWTPCCAAPRSARRRGADGCRLAAPLSGGGASLGWLAAPELAAGVLLSRRNPMPLGLLFFVAGSC